MLSFEEPLSSLPLETRLSFVVYTSHTSKFGGEDKVVLGWVNLSLFDQSRNFVGGGQVFFFSFFFFFFLVSFTHPLIYFRRWDYG